MTKQPPLAERLGAGISYTVFTTVATLCNVSVLLALQKHRKIFNKYPFYTLAKHLIIASLGELLGQYLVAIPLSFAGQPLYGDKNDDMILIVLSSLDTFFFLAIFFCSLFIALNRFLAVFCPKLHVFFYTGIWLHGICAFVWSISTVWVVVTTIIGCPKVFRHDGFYYTYRCANDTTDSAELLMHISMHMSYIVPALMLIMYALVLWKVRRLISYRSSDGYILLQSLLICFAFEVETVLFALLPKLEQTFGMFWLSLILDYVLILTTSMSSLILLLLNPLIKTTVRGFLPCKPAIKNSSDLQTNYRIYDVSDDYGKKIKEEKERRKLVKKMQDLDLCHDQI